MSATIPPPSALAASMFTHYLDRLAAKQFASVRWSSLGDVTRWTPGIPTLVVANHTNWWDGFLAHQLTRAVDRHFQIFMEREHLDRYSWFRKIGALSMERRSPRQAMRDLVAARGALAGDRWLWIFPQGRRRPAGEAIDNLEGGAGWMVARHAGPLRVVPVAFRYPFLSEQLPEPMLLIGEAWEVPLGTALNRGDAMQEITSRLATTVSALDLLVQREQLLDFRVLIAGKRSINNRLDAIRHRLGLIGEHRERNG